MDILIHKNTKESIFSYRNKTLYHVIDGYSLIAGHTDIENLFKLIMHSVWPGVLDIDALLHTYSIDDEIQFISSIARKKLLGKFYNNLKNRNVVNNFLYLISKYLNIEIKTNDTDSYINVDVITYKWKELTMRISTNNITILYNEGNPDDFITVILDDPKLFTETITKNNYTNLIELFQDTPAHIISKHLKNTDIKSVITFNTPLYINDPLEYIAQLPNSKHIFELYEYLK